jgi:glycerol-3-phosphate acyltransferase PlsX
MSQDLITIAIDAMGGDEAPQSEVAGAVEAIRDSEDINIVLVGQSDKIEKELKKHKYDKDRIITVHCNEVIGMHESPTEALKKKPDSSIIVGLKLQRQKQADAFISAGNTGAVMAASLLILGRIANVTRPTIGSIFPTDKGISIVFDVGASVDNKPIHLLEFAVMGVEYAKHIYNVENPRVAVLNVGEEESKGNTLSIETYQLLKQSNLNFIGNVEGRDVLRGKAEVIVCDGFVGNVVLKFAESVIPVLKGKFMQYASQNFFKKVWIGMMYRTLKTILKDFDYQEHGGVPLLGVNGISLIGHGRSSPKAIKTMVLRAEHMVREKLNEMIQERIKDIKQLVPKTDI